MRIAAKDDRQHLTGQGIVELDPTAYSSHYGSGKLVRCLGPTSSTTTSISMLNIHAVGRGDRRHRVGFHKSWGGVGGSRDMAFLRNNN